MKFKKGDPGFGEALKRLTRYRGWELENIARAEARDDGYIHVTGPQMVTVIMELYGFEKDFQDGSWKHLDNPRGKAAADSLRFWYQENLG